MEPASVRFEERGGSKSPRRGFGRLLNFKERRAVSSVPTARVSPGTLPVDTTQRASGHASGNVNPRNRNKARQGFEHPQPAPADRGRSYGLAIIKFRTRAVR